LQSLEQRLHTEEETGRDYEATIGQNRRARDALDSRMRLAREKIAWLEQSNKDLIKDKASHIEAMVDLQAKMAFEGGEYKKMKDDLQASFTREKQLQEKQMELCKQRETDLQATVTELTKARKEREAEANEAKSRVVELVAAVVKLETQLAERSRSLEDLRAAGATRPRRGADFVAEAELHAQAEAQRSGQMQQLQEKLRKTEESANDHAKQVTVWKSLVDSRAQDLESQRGEADRLRAELARAKDAEAALDNQAKDALAKADGMEMKIIDLQAETKELQLSSAKLEKDLNQRTAELRAATSKKDEEFASAVAAARLEGEQQAQTGESSVQPQKTDSAERKEEETDVQKYKRMYQQAVDAHGEDIKALDELESTCAGLKEEVLELQRCRGEVETDLARLARSAADLEKAQKRAERAEQQVKSLSVDLETTQGVPAAAGGALPVSSGRVSGLEELLREELELDKQRLEADKLSIRKEVDELKKQLEAQKAEAPNTSSSHVATFLEKQRRIGLLEDENLRLKKDLGEAELLETQKSSLGAERGLKELQKREAQHRQNEESWQKERAELKATSERSNKASAEAEQRRVALGEQLTSARKELSQRTQEATQGKESNPRAEELTKQLKQEKENTQELQKKINQADAVKQLHMRRIEEFEHILRTNREKNAAKSSGAGGADAEKVKTLELQLKTLKDQQGKLTQEREAEQKKRLETEAQLKKAQEEEAKFRSRSQENNKRAEAAQEKANEAMSLAMDFQNAIAVAQSRAQANPSEAAPAASETLASASDSPNLTSAAFAEQSAATDAVTGKRKEAPGAAEGGSAFSAEATTLEAVPDAAQATEEREPKAARTSAQNSPAAKRAPIARRGLLSSAIQAATSAPTSTSASSSGVGATSSQNESAAPSSGGTQEIEVLDIDDD